MENKRSFHKEKRINFFFPIALILTIVPLIVRFKTISVGQETIDMFGSKATTDLFSQNKFIALSFFCSILVILSIIFFKRIFTKKDKMINFTLILVGIFLALSLISTLLSQYKDIALWGVYDRAEGFITIACYIILFIYSIFAFKGQKDFKSIAVPILILVFINGFLGIFQYLGQDLMKTSLGAIFANVDPKSLSFLYDTGRIYGTLYHYNYVGSFAAIVLPIIIGYILVEDDVFLKLVSMLALAFGIWLLFGSTSRAGLIGVTSSIIFAVIIFRKRLFKNVKTLVITVVSVLVLSIILNFATGGKIFNRIPTLVSDAFSIFSNNSDFDYKADLPVKDVEHVYGKIKVTIQDEILNISYEDNNYVLRNENGDIINYAKGVDTKTKAKTLTTNDPKFSHISFRYGPYINKNRDDGLLLNIDGNPSFMFNLKDDNSIHMINGNSRQDIDIVYPETFGFKGKEKLGSSRGYIWSRSIPMIKDNLLIGKGPDTFVFYFPQDDLIGKLYAYGSSTQTVDKPHNLYLQIALNNGLIALLAFLAIIVMYIIDSLKLYNTKTIFTETSTMGCSIFLSIIGYLFAGIFNDSVISVAPIFWVLLGVGIATNYINKKSIKKSLNTLYK